MAEEKVPFGDDEVFEPLDVGGFDEEVEAHRIKPLSKGKYRLKITDYITRKSGPDSKKPGTPYAKFKCEVIGDSDSSNNGRVCLTGPLMLQGAGFTFFLDFVLLVTPSPIWKKGEKILEASGRSRLLDKFIGCEFLADLTPEIRDDGTESGFSVMDNVSKI